MTRPRPLQGRRVAVLATDGFELVELTVPVAALRAAGATVHIVSLRAGRIRGMNLHEPAARVRVDRLLGDVTPEEYDALLIPGGFINPDLLRQSEAARLFVRAFDETRKPIATLCHGPWLLASAGVTPGRVLTSWPGIRDDLVHAGATWLDEDVVYDGNWVSSRGPQDLTAFTRATLTHFGDAPTELRARSALTLSAPQRSEPPAAAISAMKWTPLPALRGALELGVLSAAAWTLLRNVGKEARHP
ncbi:type 1 glutamine amidotransferase domain-containing protein [Deinococcus pimensis]|uniref:type 1 glutamine amidotransferase domain-containing protein n=1 Tax=Deinococcus pimensis TaxID=309888 RepID=UPI00047F4CFF|nr:type 1 glutamine amidotransferase domain-containing protein [Deinococcus pimensis]